MAFQKNLAAQESAVREVDHGSFHALDEEFHRLIAVAAQRLEAVELILEEKAVTDRICVPSLKRSEEMRLLLQGHRTVLERLLQGDKERLQEKLRLHLSRIEKTIAVVQDAYSEHFMDERACRCRASATLSTGQRAPR